MLRFHGGVHSYVTGLWFAGPLVSDFGGLKFWSPCLQQFIQRLALPCCKVGQVGATMTVRGITFRIQQTINTGVLGYTGL